MLDYTNLPDSTPQQHAATIPGIKMLHLLQRTHLVIGTKPLAGKVTITWNNQIICALNLFFHNNNAYLLNSVVSYKPYTQSLEFTSLLEVFSEVHA